MMERRGNLQLIISITSVLSLMVASITVITFIQTSERRITTMEVRIENLKDVIERLRVDLDKIPSKRQP